MIIFNIQYFQRAQILYPLMEGLNKNINKCPLTPMGVLAPRSAHKRPSAWPPIDMSGNFPAHVSAELP